MLGQEISEGLQGEVVFVLRRQEEPKESTQCREPLSRRKSHSAQTAGNADKFPKGTGKPCSEGSSMTPAGTAHGESL